MRHLVQKQEFNITASFLQPALQWESRAGDMMRNVITPTIEKCFDKFSAADAVQIIDRLEIDLGVLHAGISEDEIKRIVTQQLMKALVEYAVVPGKKQTGYVNDEVRQSGHKYNYLNDREAKQKCFIHFLLHGLLPWWADSTSIQFSKEWLEGLTPEQIHSIRDTLYAGKQARQRLAEQFSIDFIAALIRLQKPELFEDVVAVWGKMENIPAIKNRDFLSMQKEYWVYWISISVGLKETAIPFRQVLKKWIKGHPGIKQELQKITDDIKLTGASIQIEGVDISGRNAMVILKEIFLSALDDQAIMPDKNTDLAGHNDTKQNTAADQSVSSMPVDSKHGNGLSSADILRNKNEINKKIAGNGVNKGDKPAKEKMGAEDLFAEDAGLVLLHPFLYELFRNFDLLDDKQQWVSPDAQQTGVLLTAWLAHGETNIPEYRLIIPKLFCGMLWEEVMDTSILLNDAHVLSATQMLEAVIGHWKAIGKTSLDGLREGFINRQGKLSVKEGGWLITVEKKAQDVLLARLPWGLSMIHFPWLKNTVIHVDWA